MKFVSHIQNMTIKRAFGEIKSTIRFALLILLLSVKKKNIEDIWLISERPDQARDNGYCFFKYIREKHPEVQAYYVIDVNANDYKKIERYGNIIHFNSWKHYYYFLLSNKHISAHVCGCNPTNSTILRYLKNKLKYKDIFLPHGVSYGITEFCLKKYAQIDLFICSGKPEYENILKNYGYEKSEVAYTGFPRLDSWHNITINERQILIMPTWRVYLAHDKAINISETLYFKTYYQLLNNCRLISFLENNDLELIFYLHHEMRKYVNEFKSKSNNIIVVYRDNQYDIQELLKSAALLITDFSSVHFDFAYMNKPVIYFHFDYEEFSRKQYQIGNFNYDHNGFGPVTHNEEELFNEIEKYYNNGFILNDYYYQRMRDFYQIYDNQNCDRVYKEIVRM